MPFAHIPLYAQYYGFWTAEKLNQRKAGTRRKMYKGSTVPSFTIIHYLQSLLSKSASQAIASRKEWRPHREPLASTRRKGQESHPATITAERKQQQHRKQRLQKFELDALAPAPVYGGNRAASSASSPSLERESRTRRCRTQVGPRRVW